MRNCRFPISDFRLPQWFGWHGQAAVSLARAVPHSALAPLVRESRPLVRESLLAPTVAGIPSRAGLAAALLLLAFCALPARAATITYSLVNPASDTVPLGGSVTLEIRATFDTRASGFQFTLSAVGSAGAMLTARSLNPTGANGLTYLSSTSQVPFQNNLPANLVTTPVKEVAYDADYGGAAGGPLDGLAPGMNVLIETVTITPTQTGMVTIGISNPRAVHTTTNPDGVMFETAQISGAASSVTLTVVPPLPGDTNLDGRVDLVDYAALSGCINGPAEADAFVPLSEPCLQAAGPLAYDADVDLIDLATFQNAFTGP